MLKNAAVIGGLGVVGTATRKLFGIDTYFDLKGSNASLKDVAKKKYVFICLPTEPDIDGYNVEGIYQILKEAEQFPHIDKMYILRSTVIPGTTQALKTRLGIDNLVYVPEFLTMKTIDDDTFNPDILVVGADKQDWGVEVMNIFMDHIKSKPKKFVVGTQEAEMIKLSINLFYTTKVVWANQIYDICKQLGINYDVIKQSWEERKFMSKNHFDIWHDGYRGAGGKCLRKDLIAFNRAFNNQLFNKIEALNETLLGQHV